MRPMTRWTTAILMLSLVGFAVAADDKKAPASQPKDKDGWRSLFNGKDLEGWKSTNFGGEGEVSVKDGAMIIGSGEILSGANYTGKTPKMNYEVELDAQRVNGSDF